MIKINLLGDSLAAAQRPRKGAAEPVQEAVTTGPVAGRSTLPVAGLLVAVGCAAFGPGYYFMLNRDLNRAQEKLTALEAEKKELEQYNQLFQKFQRQKEELQRKLDVIRKLKADQELPVHFLEELANCIPDDLWFMDLTQKGRGITIKGQAGSFEAINQFREALTADTKWFKNVNQQEGTKGANGKAIDFVVTFDLVEPS